MLPIAPRGNCPNPNGFASVEQEGGGKLLRPESPGCVEKKYSKGSAGIDFGDFLYEKSTRNGADDACDGAGARDSPVDRVQFPAGERSCKGYGNNESQ